MAYKICSCGEELLEPTISEAIHRQLCSSCGEDNSRDYDLTYLLEGFLERIEDLEQKSFT